MIFVDDDAQFSLESFSSIVAELELDAVLKDDAYDFVIGRRHASILYKSYSGFIEKISDIIKGNNIDLYYKEWAYVGVIDDVLLLDISNAIIFYDLHEELSKTADHLNKQYPPKLKQAIISSTEVIIRAKIKGIVRFQKNLFISSVAVNELLVAFIRRMYAIYEIYNPGLKHVFSKNNLEFLHYNIPELYKIYELYVKCERDNYEPLYSFIEKSMEK